MRIIGLGDSATAGTACGCEDYVTGLGHLMAAQDHRAVSVDNAGDSGSTSADLIFDLEYRSRTRDAVRGADVVVVPVGANDLEPALDR